MHDDIEIYVSGNPGIREMARKAAAIGLFAIGIILGYGYCWLQMVPE